MAEPGWFRPLYIILQIWQTFGYSTVIYIAAMMSIDLEQYEAADIDGATPVSYTHLIRNSINMRNWQRGFCTICWKKCGIRKLVIFMIFIGKRMKKHM